MSAPGWIAIGHFAVETKSISQAARIVARLNRRRARLDSNSTGTTNGCRWMGLARFEREQGARS